MTRNRQKIEPRDLRRTERAHGEVTDRRKLRSSERRSVQRRRSETRYTRARHQKRRRGGVPWWVWLLGLLALGLILLMVFAG
jgi:hypothetical protein